MKLVLLALPIFFATFLEARFIVWPQGTEFQYDFYGHHLSSVEKVGNRVVGVGHKALVRVYAVSQQQIVVKFDQFKVASINEDTIEIDEDALPWTFQTSPSSLTGFLEQPFRAQIEEGRIAWFEVSRDEPEESVNIKKALLTMFQVDTSKILAPSSSPYRLPVDPLGSYRSKARPNMKYSNQLTPSDDDVNVVRYMEDGVIGKCQSSYVITSEPSPYFPKADVMNITKYRNFNKCENKPEWTRTTNVPVECADCDADDFHPYPTVNKLDYDIKKRGNELIIESIVSEAQTQFKPFTENSDYMVANHTMKLDLMRFKPISGNVPQPVNTVKYDNLRYVFPTAKRALKAGPYSIKKPLVPFLNDKKIDSVAEATQLFEKVLNLIVEEVTKSHYEDLTTLEMYDCVRAIRLMTYDEINQFYQNVGVARRDTVQADDRMQLFVQLVAMSGSAPSVLYIKYMIESQMLVGELAAHTVAALATNMYEVHFDLINEILSMAKSRVVRESPQIFKTVWLSFGILISRACNGPDDDIPILPHPPHIKVFCPQEVERKFLQDIGEQLQATSELDEILLYLKVLGLTELPGAVEFIAPYAQGEMIYHESVQIAALRSLRPIAKFNPEEVIEVAEPEFYDTDNSIPVRIAALRVMLASQPDFSQLKRIVTWADKEPSDDVSGYIYSFFDSISNASHYCLEDLSNDAQQLLAYLDDEDDNGIQGSNVWESSQTFDEEGVSTQTYAAWTKSNSSIIPETIIFRNNLTVAGYSVKPILFHIHTKGIQTIIDRLMGPKGSFRKIKSIEDLFKPESQDEEKKRTKINDKLNLDTREDDAFMINAFVKLGDTQARMFYADYKSIIEYFNKHRFDIMRFRDGIPIHIHKLSLMFELQHQMPSILGIPMILNIFHPTIMSLKGKIAFSLDTRSDSLLPNGIRVEAELKSSFQSRLSTRMGVYCPFDKVVSVAGVASSSYVNAPIVARAEYKALEEKFNFQLKPISTETHPTSEMVKLFDHKVKTFGCRYRLTTMIDNCQQPKLIHKDLTPDLNEIDFSQKYLGVPITFKSQSELEWDDMGSYLSDLAEYDDVFSYVSTIWTLPDFAPRHYQLLLQNKKVSEKAIDVSFAWDYKPSAIEQKILESANSYRGLWTAIFGFGKLPQRCGSKGSEIDPSDEFWYVEDKDKDADDDDEDDDDIYDQVQYFSEKAKGSVKSYKSKSPFYYDESYLDTRTYPSYKSSPVAQRFASRSSFTSVPSTIEEFPRSHEVSILTVEMKATARGTDAQVASKFVFKRDLSALMDIFSLTFDLTNIPLVTPNKLQICTNGIVKYPETPCDFHGKMNPAFTKPILSDVKMAWGQQCADPKITIKLKLEKSEEQLASEQTKDDWFYDQCQEDIRRGMKLSTACDLVKLEVSSLNKFVLDADYTQAQLPQWFLNATRKLDTMLKVHNYHQMTNNPVNVRNQEGHLKMTGFLYKDVTAYDLQMYKPRENTFYKKVPFGEHYIYLYPISTRVTVVEQFLDDITDGMAKPSCEVMGISVNTFDNHTYKFPLTPCQHVIAKDCSQDDLFAITMSKFENSQTAKELRVYVLSHEIVVKPMGRYSGQFHIEIDSKIVTPTDDKAVLLKTEDKDATGMYVAVLLKTGPLLHIQLPFTGVYVIFDGEDARVVVSHFWEGKVCGLCGEFREETFEDLVGPQQCILPDPISFGLSYGLEDYGCKLPSPPNPNKQCGSDDNAFSSYNSYSFQTQAQKPKLFNRKYNF